MIGRKIYYVFGNKYSLCTCDCDERGPIDLSHVTHRACVAAVFVIYGCERIHNLNRSVSTGLFSLEQTPKNIFI